MKGFHLGRFLLTVVVILGIIAVASRIGVVRKFVFNIA